MELLAKTCNYERMNVQRLMARMFVVAGGLFWMAAAFGASFSYQDKPLVESVGTALIPIGIAVIALALGWFYEVLTAAVLFAGAVGVVVWGFVAGWEPGVWVVMLAVLAAPMAIAGLLYLLAARMQNTCSLEEAGI